MTDIIFCVIINLNKKKDKGVYMNFMDNLIKENNKTQTDNGDLAYRSTLNENLDFFGSAGTLHVEKNNFDNEVYTLYKDAYQEDSELALKNALYYRDIKNGTGRREGFRQILVYLANKSPKDFERVMKLVPEYGRYDDLTSIVFNINNEESLSILNAFISKTFFEDLENVDSKNITLLGKWMPSANSKVSQTRNLGLYWARALELSERNYRKALSKLRSAINIVETKLSNRDYTFDYSKLPSRALMKYTEAFKNNDSVRYQEFVDELSSNPATVANKVENLYPYEVIRKLRGDKKMAEALWEAYPKDSIEGNVIVVRDGSVSMYSGRNPYVTPIEISDSMAIYTAERLTGKFKDRFITFSSRPELVDLKNYSSLEEKINKLHNYCDIADTNIDKTMKLIFDSSKGLPLEDQLDTILIISDMQFNSHRYSVSQSVMDKWKAEFKAADLKWPEIVYWNVNDSKISFPTSEFDNVKLVSGFSKSILEDVMNNNTKNAVEFMLEVLSRYNP